MPQPWELKQTVQVGDFRIFTVHVQTRVNPRTQKDFDFFLLNTRNWVNIIALTPDDQMVFVEQFRPGTNTVDLEIPGGVIDHDHEDPVTSGLRELREETGYDGDHPELIGTISPNPAIMNNLCHTVLVRNCHQRHETDFDPGEDMVTRLVPLADIPELIRTGVIRHAIVVVALHYFELWKQKQAKKGSSEGSECFPKG